MYDVCVIGGCGHVGLPLSIALAARGKRVCAQDLNGNAVETVSRGVMPFMEEGAESLLKKVLAEGYLTVTTDRGCLSESDVVIFVIGTPVDEHLNPKFSLMQNAIEQYIDYFRDGQLLVLRSTLYPGISEKVYHWILKKGKKIHVAFCPERILEGHALSELESLPQIISSFSEEGLAKSRELFSLLTRDLVVLDPMEAELAKLFTNVWRYIKFATANQFYILANEYGLDFYKIYHAMTHNYDRAKDFPKPGFAAGPCLFKDAMQLGAFNDGNFYLGHTAMLINEGMPNYVVKKLKEKYELSKMNVGILGMAFKGESDDARESLSYKLKKILQIEAQEVFCTDPYVRDEKLQPLEEVLIQSDILIVAAPHNEYKALQGGEKVRGKVVADIWNIMGNGGIV
jgi:UDP-N-acetyl-D-mannosaminuronic acid dehydrogenase